MEFVAWRGLIWKHKLIFSLLTLLGKTSDKRISQKVQVKMYYCNKTFDGPWNVGCKQNNLLSWLVYVMMSLSLPVIWINMIRKQSLIVKPCRGEERETCCRVMMCKAFLKKNRKEQECLNLQVVSELAGLLTICRLRFLWKKKRTRKFLVAWVLVCFSPEFYVVDLLATQKSPMTISSELQ